MGKVEQGDVVKLNAMFTALDADAVGRVDVGVLVARADPARERLEKRPPRAHARRRRRLVSLPGAQAAEPRRSVRRAAHLTTGACHLPTGPPFTRQLLRRAPRLATRLLRLELRRPPRARRLTPTPNPHLSPFTLARIRTRTLTPTSSQAASTWGGAPPFGTTCWAAPTACTPPSVHARSPPPPPPRPRCRWVAPHGAAQRGAA